MSATMMISVRNEGTRAASRRRGRTTLGKVARECSSRVVVLLPYVLLLKLLTTKMHYDPSSLSPSFSMPRMQQVLGFQHHQTRARNVREGWNTIVHSHQQTIARPSFSTRLQLSTGIGSFIGSRGKSNNVQVVVDTASVTLGFLFLIGYHIHLYRKERNHEKTWRTEQASTREKWSRFVRQTEQWLYAIQTLRNAITAQTFLATTVLSLLTVIGGRLWDILRTMRNSATSTATATTNALLQDKYLLTTQFILLAVCMLSSAYQFLQSARLMTHAGFMFPVEPHTTKVDNIMRKSQNSQWAGLRFLYISVVFIVWVVSGPKSFCLSSLLMTFFFQNIDKVPKGVMDNDYITMI